MRFADARRSASMHDQQFHQIVIRRMAGRLNDEHVLAADIFVNFDENLVVGKAADRWRRSAATPYIRRLRLCASGRLAVAVIKFHIARPRPKNPNLDS